MVWTCCALVLEHFEWWSVTISLMTPHSSVALHNSNNAYLLSQCTMAHQDLVLLQIHQSSMKVYCDGTSTQTEELHSIFNELLDNFVSKLESLLKEQRIMHFC